MHCRHRDDPNTGWWGAQPKSRTLKMFINIFGVAECVPTQHCHIITCYIQPVLAVSFSFPFSRCVRFQFEIERPMIIERLKRRAWLVVVVCRNGGAFAVVPGTHRLPHGPWETLGRSFRSTMTLDAELVELQMPNWFKFGARDSFFLVSCSVDFSFAGRLLTRVHVVWSV